MEQWLCIQFYIFSLASIIVTLYELLQFEWSISYLYYMNTPELLPGLIQMVSFVNMMERTYWLKFILYQNLASPAWKEMQSWIHVWD